MITVLEVPGRIESRVCPVCEGVIKRRERRQYVRGSNPDELYGRGTYWEALAHRVLPCGRYCQVGAPQEAEASEVHYPHCFACQRVKFHQRRINHRLLSEATR